MIQFNVSHYHPESSRKFDAFYLMPLKKRKEDIWISSVAVGHNKLRNTVKCMCADADIKGFKTNHSLQQQPDYSKPELMNN